MNNSFDEKSFFLRDDEAGFGVLHSGPLPPPLPSSPPFPGNNPGDGMAAAVSATAPHASNPPPVASPASPQPPPPARRRRVLTTWVLAALIAVILCISAMTAIVFASSVQITPPPAGNPTTPAHRQGTQGNRPPTQQPTRPASPGLTPTPIYVTSGDLQLPQNWNRSNADAVLALRSAIAFVDREMTLDFREAGTRAHHGGTFTASVFLLTPAAKIRFQANDVRAANNTLYDQVQQQHLVQQTINEYASILSYTHNQQQQLVTVSVTFQLYKSQLGQAASEVKDVNRHLMTVLLLHVDQAGQGPDAPMGGTGWLVSNYGLDVATVPTPQPA